MYGLVWMASCPKGLAWPGQGPENCLIRVSYLSQIHGFFRDFVSTAQPGAAGLLGRCGLENWRFSSCSPGDANPGDELEVPIAVARALLGLLLMGALVQAGIKAGAPVHHIERHLRLKQLLKQAASAGSSGHRSQPLPTSPMALCSQKVAFFRFCSPGACHPRG